MALDLILTGATFNNTGKFNKSLSGGTAKSDPAFLYNTAQLTIEAWIKSAAPAMGCAIGMPSFFWMGTDVDGKFSATISNPSTYLTENYLSASSIADNVHHHIAMCASTTGTKFYLDGVLIGTSAAVSTNTMRQYELGLRHLPNNGLGFNGEIDDVVVTNGVKYTGNFTPPVASVSNSAANLIAVWHLDGTGVNSMGTDPTAPVFTTAPNVVGTPTVGEASGFVGGNITTNQSPDVTQQWVIADTLNGVTTDIAGATGLTYTPILANVGKFIGVRQKAVNSAAPNGVTSTSVLKQVVSNVAASPRTVKGVLRLDEETLGANLTNLSVSVSTGTGPHNRGNILYQSNTQTTNALGEYNIAFDSTEVAVGGQALMMVLGPNGINVMGQVGVTA